jgi:hypothetical protein
MRFAKKIQEQATALRWRVVRIDFWEHLNDPATGSYDPAMVTKPK